MTPPKIIIERSSLSPTGSDELQRIATVYIGQDEYAVLAPPKAAGNALSWVDTWSVRKPSRDQSGDLMVEGSDASHFIQLVKGELERQTRPPGNDVAKYYHVRIWSAIDPALEVKFDLHRNELEDRILERYRNGHPVVLGGRTILVKDIQRIQVIETARPCSAFLDWTMAHYKAGVDDAFVAESDARDVTDELVTTPNVFSIPENDDAIELLCHRFHTVVRQLRHRRAGRPALVIADEYDAQYLFHMLLRVFFDDIRPEEWTPTYAGKSARMDFLIPTAETVLELKMARNGLGEKQLGSELIEDIARYRKHQSCKKLVCFVYDPGNHISNPRGIERDLSRVEEGFAVTVIIKP